MEKRPYYHFVENEGYVRVLANEHNEIMSIALLKTKLVRNYSALCLIKKDLDLVKETLTLLEAGVEN